MVIATEDWQTTNSLRLQLDAHYPFLYDEEKRVRDELGILEYTDTQHQPTIVHVQVIAHHAKRLLDLGMDQRIGRIARSSRSSSTTGARSGSSTRIPASPW